MQVQREDVRRGAPASEAAVAAVIDGGKVPPIVVTPWRLTTVGASVDAGLWRERARGTKWK